MFRQQIAIIALMIQFATAAMSCADARTSQPAGRSLAQSLRPAIKNGGFRMDGYILWCSPVIKVGDTYHMFASRWPAQYEMGGWTKYSECVRAISLGCRPRVC